MIFHLLCILVHLETVYKSSSSRVIG